MSDAAGDHPGVDHDQRVAVADQDDAAADAIAGVAGVEQVDGRHRRDATRRAGATGAVSRRTGCGGSLAAGVPSSADDPRHVQPTSSCAAAASRRWTPHGARRAPSRFATGGSSRSVRDDAVRDWIGPRTRVMELRGRSVTPGFGDAHVHPVSAGVGQMRCDLSAARGLDTYLEIIAAYAAAHPDETWIRGDGWSMADFPGGIPHRDDLDRVVPDRPVYLDSRDGHTAWVNSKALELAGVTADTPDPDDGRIERDADGRPIRRSPGGSGRPRRTPASRGHARGTRRGPAAGPGRAPRPGRHQLAGRQRQPRRQARSPTRRSPVAAS